MYHTKNTKKRDALLDQAERLYLYQGSTVPYLGDNYRIPGPNHMDNINYILDLVPTGYKNSRVVPTIHLPNYAGQYVLTNHKGQPQVSFNHLEDQLNYLRLDPTTHLRPAYVRPDGLPTFRYNPIASKLAQH